MYLLDTNVLSELRKIKQNRANTNVVNWLQTVSANELYISVIVLMELQKGILNIRRKDSAQADALQSWLDSIKETFESHTLNIDNDTASICAQIHIPDPAPANDAWIAATAMQHSLTLVTRNVADFNIKGLKVFNPFD